MGANKSLIGTADELIKRLVWLLTIVLVRAIGTIVVTVVERFPLRFRRW